ncbi:hypothetical protein [Limnohabitans sp.]|nr:hypothetical protein [Limnohabitans sp.]
MKYAHTFDHLGNPVQHVTPRGYKAHRVIQTVLIIINIMGLLMLMKVK